MLPRLILALAGSVFVAVGAYFLVFPDSGAGVVGIALTSPLAASDVRAVYGGLDLAVGALLLHAVCTGELASGLRIQIVAFGGLLLGRVIGHLLDGPEDSVAMILMAVEGTGLLFGLYGRSMLRRFEVA